MKKSIRDFVGIAKNKTDVRLTIDQLNEAIVNSAVKASMSGLELCPKKIQGNKIFDECAKKSVKDTE